MPKKKVNIPRILMIFKLVNPEYLKIWSSLFSIKYMKKIWEDIRKIKGMISKITDGAFNKDKNNGNVKLTSISLKKSICSKIFNKTINVKKIKKTFVKDFKKRLIKNFI